jgi:hypothetical protein
MMTYTKKKNNRIVFVFSIVFSFLACFFVSVSPFSVSVSASKANYLTSKTVFTEPTLGPRFVFVAGLEGTGHHSMSLIFKECVQKKICDPSRNLTPFIWNGCGRPKDLIASQGADIGDPNAAQQKFKEELRRVKSDARNAGKIFFLNTLNESSRFRPGMISYPNCKGNEIFADVEILARLLEEEGLDFRVLVLHRPSHSIIKSTVIKRRFRIQHVQEQLLTHAAAVLFSQLYNIDPRFYEIIRYQDLNNSPYWTDTLTPFLFGTTPDKLNFQLHFSEKHYQKAVNEAAVTRANDDGSFFRETKLWDSSERVDYYNSLLLRLGR